MKREFEKPEIKVVLIDNEDVIKTSGEVAWWGSLPGTETGD